MGFFRLLLILLLIYLGYKILRFSVLMYLTQKKYQRENELPKEGSTKVKYDPLQSKSKHSKPEHDDDYTSFEEIR